MRAMATRLYSLTNASTGTLNITADAVANGATRGYAYAYLASGISQNASAYGAGHTASVALDNSGTLNITANGTAAATTGYADALRL